MVILDALDAVALFIGRACLAFAVLLVVAHCLSRFLDRRAGRRRP